MFINQRVNSHLVRVVVDGLSSKVPDAERDVFAIVLDDPRRYVNAVCDLFAVAATVYVLALCQRVHQAIHNTQSLTHFHTRRRLICTSVI